MALSRRSKTLSGGRRDVVTVGIMTDTFRTWLRQNGIMFDGLRVRPASGCTRGMATITATSFSPGEALAVIPKEAVLSVRNTGIAPLLQRLMAEANIPSSTCHIAAVAYEQSMGAKSKWHGYLSSTPPFEPLPFMWSKLELAQLCGTGLDTEALCRRRDLLEEHRRLVEALECLRAGGKASKGRTSSAEMDLPSLHSAEAFLKAATLTSSRAFYIDDWHGEALVPLADMLNHKAALVPDGAVVEGGDGGSADEEKEDEEMEEMEEEETEEMEEMEEVEEDDDDDDERDTRLVSERRRSAARSLAAEWRVGLEMDTTLHNVNAGEEGPAEAAGHVALVALRALRAGHEVFNTYGEHSNRTLLRDYGFVLSRNPLDAAELPWRVVRRAVASVTAESERWLRHRERALLASPCGACLATLIRPGDGEKEASFTFAVDGSPPSELLYVLWLLMAQPAAQPRWMCTSPPEVAGRDDAVNGGGGGTAAAVTAAAAVAADIEAAEEAAREFMRRPFEQQIEPATPLLARPSEVIAAAVSDHAASAYPSTPPRGRHEPAKLSAERVAQAAAIVAGERAIWRRALTMAESSPRRRTNKRAREDKA